jgi:hypothetical protein
MVSLEEAIDIVTDYLKPFPVHRIVRGVSEDPSGIMWEITADVGILRRILVRLWVNKSNGEIEGARVL